MKLPKRLPVYASVCTLVLMAACAASAQQPTGNLVGNAYDPSGASVAGAQIALRNLDTGETKSVTTNPEGYYEFVQVRPANYEVSAEAKGFRRLHKAGIVVNVGSVVRVDLRFDVGELTATVEVTAEIPLIEPDKTSITRSVDLKAIANLPMLGRDFLALAQTAPGTIPGAPGTQVRAFSVAGMRSQSNNYTLDGISNNDPQVNGPLNSFHLADAIQEFNVQTSIATSDVGRNSGAQVNIITKGGTNDLHATLFYTMRNDALDANNFFLNKGGQKKNALHRHQYGGTAGGRIFRDKTFWFFSFEGFREITQRPVEALVPSAAERAAVTDPVSLKILSFYPLPTRALAAGGTGSNWTGTTASLINNETYFWRLDHNLTTNHRLMTRYAFFRGDTNELQSESRPFHGNLTNKPAQHSASIQETWAIAKLVNEARIGYSRNQTFFLPEDVALNPASIFTNAAGQPLPGYINTSTDPLNGGLPNITISGFAGLGAGTNMPQGRATNTYEAMDNLSLIGPWGWSRHTLKFGGGFRHEIANRFLNGNYRGQISFDCLIASATCPQSFAAGVPLRGSLRTGTGGTFRTWSRSVWSYYAQDSFKARPNLTINLGLRWEYFGQMQENENRGSNFVPGVGMMVLGSNLRIDIIPQSPLNPLAVGRNALILTPVSTFLPRSGMAGGDWSNYAPFLGISWSPKMLRSVFGEGKTVIRTGFRMSYDDIFANIPVNMGLNFPPVLTTTLPNGSYTWGTVLNQDRSMFNPDATVPLFGPSRQRGIVSFNAWDYNARTAYAMNYALELERQLGASYAVEVSYVGSQGRRLGVFVDPNQPTVTAIANPTLTWNQTPNLNRRTFPFQQYAGMGLGTFASNSNYNGMVATFRKRASRGFSYTASYTLGKSLDDNSSFFGSDRDTGAYADTRNRKNDHGRSGFDVRHRVVGTFVYELPFGPGRRWLNGVHGVLGHVVGGWDTSGIIQYRSGYPFTIFAGSLDFSGLNQFADRPNWAPGVNDLQIDYSNPDNVFNCHSGAGKCTVFTQPLAGTTGNAGRNRFDGPSLTNVDFGVMKNFAFAERRRVQFRAEFFNLFNKTNFKLPDSNLLFRAQLVRNSTAGTVRAAEDPRLIQFSLRLDW